MIIFTSHFLHCQQKWCYFHIVHIAGEGEREEEEEEERGRGRGREGEGGRERVKIHVHVSIKFKIYHFRIFPWILSVIDIHCYHFYKVRHTPVARIHCC